MKAKLHFFLLFFFTSSFIFSQTQKAKYSVVFTSIWSQNHQNLPSGAHWSKLVGATHKTANAFLEIGQKATTGIKNVAETGNNTVFNNEVTTAINNNEANQYINGNSLGSANGNITINNLEVDKDFSLLTLVSMIAPSPDWIIAINGVNLLDGNGNWKTSISLDLYPYDAGTDSGVNYTSANSVTNPQENITSLQNVAPFSNLKIGTLSITLTETLNTETISLKDNLKVFYNNSADEIQINKLNIIKINRIDIYNIFGKRVAMDTSSNKITLKNLSKGMYIVKVNTDKGNLTRKILKH